MRHPIPQKSRLLLISVNDHILIILTVIFKEEDAWAQSNALGLDLNHKIMKTTILS